MDRFGGFIDAHPRVLMFMTGALVVLSGAVFARAVQLDLITAQYVRDRLGEAQRAASEALGG